MSEEAKKETEAPSSEKAVDQKTETPAARKIILYPHEVKSVATAIDGATTILGIALDNFPGKGHRSASDNMAHRRISDAIQLLNSEAYKVRQWARREGV